MINGLGMGNSTRCHAVMERLHEAGVQIHVLTSGNGLKYFADRPEVASLHAMDAFFYSGKGGRVSGWRTLGSIGRLAKLERSKRKALENLLRELKPDVAILDSEYAVSPLRRRRVPIIGINNSEVIVTEFLNHPSNPRPIKNHFWLVEFSDYLFHRTFCNLIVSPSPRQGVSRHSKFKRIGMIVRRSVREAAGLTPPSGPFPKPRDVKSCVFMLSGSIFASHIDLEHFDLPFHVDVVGREGTNTRNVTYHGRLMNNVDLLLKADVLVINGGFSAVSEAVFLNKPTFVVPVPGHAEQFTNARLVGDLGYGFVADEYNVIGMMKKMYEANEWIGLKPKQPTMGANGAEEAAAAILSFLDHGR